MHRSGTSAVTRIISLLGADLPSNLMPAAAENNEAGFWESMDAYRLNDDLLASAGSSWDDWRRFNPQWIRSPAKPAFKDRALKLLEQDFGGSSLFVLKDPRICRLLPFWLEVFRDFGVVPKCVLPLRNPLEVAASLKKRDGFSPAKSLMLWLRHVVDAEQGSRGSSRALLAYDDLLDDWRRTVSKLAHDLDLAWPRRSATAEVEIDLFLEHRHRHHGFDTESLVAHPDVSLWVKEVYSALSKMRVSSAWKQEEDRLDAVRAELNQASDVLGPVLRAEEIAREELATSSSARIAELESDAATRQSRLVELEQAASAREAKVTELVQTISAQKARIGELEQKAKARIAELEHRAEESEARIDKLNAVLGAERNYKRRFLEERNQALHRLNELQTSASTQLARPVRALESRWPKLARGLALSPKLLVWTLRLGLRQRLGTRRLAKELLASGLFDPVWYVENNPDIVLGGQDPIFHWLARGWMEGRDPNPLFDIDWYLAQNPDLTRAGVNPLVHYLESGAAEGRDPNPLFDSDWYLAQNPDVARAGRNPLVHFIERGAAEGCAPSPQFDASAYLALRPDAAELGMDPLEHYLRTGAPQNRQPLHESDNQKELQLLSEWAAGSVTLEAGNPETPRLLVIDWRPPTPDRDSGSCRMSAILDCFNSKGLQVDFIGDREAIELRYGAMLRSQGITTVIGREAAIRHLYEHGPEYGLVLLSRPEIFEKYASLVRACAVNAKVVYDTVDLHWIRFLRAAAFEEESSEFAAQAESYKRMELANARSADITIAITEEEKGALLDEEPALDVRIVPNVHEVVSRVAPFSERSNLFFIGGFGHTPNIDAVHYFVSQVLPLVTSQLPEVCLKIVGSNMPADIQALASKNVYPIGYVDDVEPYFQQCRVFVAPLRHGAGMKGKVGQSLGLGLPVVTTSIGAEGIGLVDGENALICDKAEDFASGIVRLYEDESLWTRLSEEGRELIRRRFSAVAVREQVLSLLES